LLHRNQNLQTTTAASNRCNSHKCEPARGDSHMRCVKLLILSIPSLALLVSGCGGNSSQTTGGQTTGGGQTTTIYVAGFAPLPTGKAAEVWQVTNGSSTPTASALSMPSGSTASETCGAMAVSGGSVYAAGFAWNATTGIIYAPVYWVNGGGHAVTPAHRSDRCWGRC